ncbi:uncharacterized protein C8Q71DRAFT_505589 [Rhodofomes roseus]|uniref:SWIM-type domain-containing protein n=1 Tax=Rhodofomes roseus TaxID=34475 RepID=A0ABQ8KLZ2_9APHY|nr:uncharacterized protein C8Q71DRAFT_505589 [Rhodofomes roseus]KAH9839295.1 hypothetical protein C8Q71DRAFT_505589 [Rhodofomes roseus]
MATSALVPTVLESIRPDTFDEDGLEKLRFLFSDTLVLAALDLIDRESVIKYKKPWGGIQYEVYGSTANYTVFPGLPGPSPDNKSSSYCTCPAFAYSVLLSRTQIMCKHLLATLVAERLSKCIERNIQPNDLAALSVRHCAS